MVVWGKYKGLEGNMGGGWDGENRGGEGIRCGNQGERFIYKPFIDSLIFDSADRLKFFDSVRFVATYTSPVEPL